MLCDICNENEATIHITEIINDEARELHVCQKCAEAESIKMQQAFDIGDLLSGLTDFPSKILEEQSLRCPSCGMSYDDFRRSGKLGCSDCYTAFGKALLPLIKSIHGSTNHIGKEPERIMPAGKEKAAPVDKQDKKVKVATKDDRIAELKDKLNKAIQVEDYEKAAVLRDRIRALEK